jgi:hypothetical protein
MSEGLVLLTSEENPIYFNPSPTQEDEIRLNQKYKGKCLFELYETAENEAGKELCRYIVVWDEEMSQALTIADGVWVEGQGCISNAVVAQGTTEETRTQYANWFHSNFKEGEDGEADQGPIGIGYDGYTVGVIPPKEVATERIPDASVDKAKEAIQSIFNAYLSAPQ